MTELATQPTATMRHRRERRRPRFSFLSLAADLTLTATVLLVAFMVWDVFIFSEVTGGSQTESANEQAEVFAQQPEKSLYTYEEIPYASAPASAQPLAVIYIPRFGDDWQRVIREGVGKKLVLNSREAGIGHYPGTAMPGQLGNFAIAAHNTGYGNTFYDVMNLQLGDRIYVQTGDGWYTYEYRNMEYVQPDAIDALNAVPRSPEAPSERYITLTTCFPAYNTQERIAAYGTFVEFSSTKDGPPAELASMVSAGG